MRDIIINIYLHSFLIAICLILSISSSDPWRTHFNYTTGGSVDADADVDDDTGLDGNFGDGNGGHKYIYIIYF